MGHCVTEIDRIVREVLAELGTADTACAEGANGQLVLSGRVISMSDISGRIEGIRQIVVPPGAIVTPSVRDELRRGNITLAFEANSARASQRLVVVTAGNRFDPASLLDSLRKDGIDVTPHTSNCLIESTELLAREINNRNTLGLLLSTHPAAAICLANRHRGVRAVTGSDAAMVAAATDDIGANLLILDPTACGLEQLNQIVSEFHRGAVHDCPEVFRRQLS